MSKRHCMFQCALQKHNLLGYIQNQYDIVEDTDLITWEEAVELWNKCKPQVVEQLKDGQNPEMVVWTGCVDNTSYANDSFHINHSTEVENGEFVEKITKVIDPNHVTMGEPVSMPSKEVGHE